MIEGDTEGYDDSLVDWELLFRYNMLRKDWPRKENYIEVLFIKVTPLSSIGSLKSDVGLKIL